MSRMPPSHRTCCLVAGWMLVLLIPAAAKPASDEPPSPWSNVSYGALYHSVQTVAFVRWDRNSEVTPGSVRAHYQILKVAKDPSGHFHDRSRINFTEWPRKKHPEFGLL